MARDQISPRVGSSSTSVFGRVDERTRDSTRARAPRRSTACRACAAPACRPRPALERLVRARPHRLAHLLVREAPHRSRRSRTPPRRGRSGRRSSCRGRTDRADRRRRCPSAIAARRRSTARGRTAGSALGRPHRPARPGRARSVSSFISVDLPAPFGPRTAACSPMSIVRAEAVGTRTPPRTTVVSLQFQEGRVHRICAVLRTPSSRSRSRIAAGSFFTSRNFATISRAVFSSSTCSVRNHCSSVISANAFSVKQSS